MEVNFSVHRVWTWKELSFFHRVRASNNNNNKSVPQERRLQEQTGFPSEKGEVGAGREVYGVASAHRSIPSEGKMADQLVTRVTHTSLFFFNRSIWVWNPKKEFGNNKVGRGTTRIRVRMTTNRHGPLIKTHRHIGIYLFGLFHFLK